MLSSLVLKFGGVTELIENKSRPSALLFMHFI